MKIFRLLMVALAAFFIVPASAQNAGTVTNHAFAVGKGPGQTGFTSLLCAATELAVGQTSANPACKSLSGDVTMDANGATTIGTNKVTDGMLRQSGALSLIGRSANSTGNVADISAVSGSGCAYREAGNVVGCGQLATAALGANTVTNAKLAQMANGTTKCRTTAGTGDPEDCTASQMRTLLSLVVGTNVQAWDADLDCYAALTGTGIIRRTGSGTCSNGTAVANSELATMANGTIKGNVSGSSATPSDITPSQALDVIGTTRGSILYRGASGWTYLSPGTAGQVVTSNGAGADPNYQDPTGGSGGFGDTDRRNFLLSTVYQSKSFASYRRLINLFATGFKGANDTANGINTGSSSSYAVDSANGLVKPTFTAGSDQTATHTGYTAGGNTASASSETSGFSAWKAFDKVTGGTSGTGTWVSNATATGWLQYQFGTAKTIGSYTVRSGNGFATRSPKDWTLLGSNTGSFTGEEVTLDTRSGETSWTSGGQVRTYTVATPGSYAYYRLNVSANNGDGYLLVDEMTLSTSDIYSSMTLVTATQTTDASVSNGRVLLEFDSTATPTLNTDLTAEVTCNGGTNWASATLSAITAYSQGGRSVAETADTACTAGTSFAARIKTFSSKNIPIYGATLSVH